MRKSLFILLKRGEEKNKASSSMILKACEGYVLFLLHSVLFFFGGFRELWFAFQQLWTNHITFLFWYFQTRHICLPISILVNQFSVPKASTMPERWLRFDQKTTSITIFKSSYHTSCCWCFRSHHLSYMFNFSKKESMEMNGIQDEWPPFSFLFRWNYSSLVTETCYHTPTPASLTSFVELPLPADRKLHLFSHLGINHPDGNQTSMTYNLQLWSSCYTKWTCQHPRKPSC